MDCHASFKELGIVSLRGYRFPKLLEDTIMVIVFEDGRVVSIKASDIIREN